MIDAPAAPTRTGYAETNGARIYYQVHSDPQSGKTPLLVLHGSYMSAESMAPLVARFAATRVSLLRRSCTCAAWNASR
jgi:pimeloyl-ACP methyl ester carboxylesterase